MKAVVFGGSGFIGSHVADELSRRKYDVRIFDREASPYLNSEQQMVIGDITNEELVRKAVDGCDIVYNFAAISDIDECRKRPLDVIETNIMGNARILEACKNNNIKRYIFASTVYVYGDWGAFYKSSKQACELFIDDYSKIYGLPYTILRYGSLYGDRAGGGNSIYRFLKEALTEGTITYHGTGDEIREWIHVRDAAISSVDMLDDAYEGQSVIITGQRAMRYKEILEMICEMTKGNTKVLFEKKVADTHYTATPCTFTPKFAKKIIPQQCVDIGQGLMKCAAGVFDELHGKTIER